MLLNLLLKCGVRFDKKWLHLALDCFEQKRAKNNKNMKLSTLFVDIQGQN